MNTKTNKTIGEEYCKEVIDWYLGIKFLKIKKYIGYWLAVKMAVGHMVVGQWGFV